MIRKKKELANPNFIFHNEEANFFAIPHISKPTFEKLTSLTMSSEPAHKKQRTKSTLSNVTQALVKTFKCFSENLKEEDLNFKITPELSDNHQEETILGCKTITGLGSLQYKVNFKFNIPGFLEVHGYSSLFLRRSVDAKGTMDYDTSLEDENVVAVGYKIDEDYLEENDEDELLDCLSDFVESTFLTYICDLVFFENRKAYDISICTLSEDIQLEPAL